LPLAGELVGLSPEATTVCMWHGSSRGSSIAISAAASRRSSCHVLTQARTTSVGAPCRGADRSQQKQIQSSSDSISRAHEPQRVVRVLAPRALNGAARNQVCLMTSNRRQCGPPRSKPSGALLERLHFSLPAEPTRPRFTSCCDTFPLRGECGAALAADDHSIIHADETIRTFTGEDSTLPWNGSGHWAGARRRGRRWLGRRPSAGVAPRFPGRKPRPYSLWSLTLSPAIRKTIP